MDSLASAKILVGVSGGIAAYKSADLVRRLREAGAEVRVAMTANAVRFITPLTLQAVSGQRVHDTLLDAEAESGMSHIELARWADAVIVAPASANLLARLAHGIADDLLTTVCLATEAPLFVAPAMNRLMWSKAATQRNVERLVADGVTVLGPGEGDQACGEVGPGRMLEPADLVARLAGHLTAPLLAGVRTVVTAGPTWEAIDPVRGITNLSSGKMGYAIAAAARRAGAVVTLVSGPTALESPPGVTRVPVRSAQDMLAAVESLLDRADLFIGVAAVADYRPQTVAGAKIKKTAPSMTLSLVRTPDILASVGRSSRRPFIVGFAAETEDVVANARAKLTAKGADLIAANAVSADGAVFGADANHLILVEADATTDLGTDTKERLAARLVAEIARRYHAKGRA